MGIDFKNYPARWNTPAFRAALLTRYSYLGDSLDDHGIIAILFLDDHYDGISNPLLVVKIDLLKALENIKLFTPKISSLQRLKRDILLDSGILKPC